MSDVPITSVSGDSLLAQGQTNVGSVLNDLPQLASTFSQQNPGSGIGIAGLNLLDLRGLGTSRTLVLVNGRRHVAADILNNAVSPDVNSIPNNLIDRIDIVTGGNSAVYGSDAIAGVVNFILKRDYNGIELRGSTGINEPGFGGNQLISVLAGKNFADGRGNITVSGQFTHQDRVYASNVPYFRTVNGIVTVDTDPAGLANGSDGFPDAIFLRDIRSATNSPYGLIPIQQTPNAAACGTGTLPTAGGPNNLGTPYNCSYIFTQDGRLTPQTGTRYGAGPFGGIIGGNGATGREGKLVSILPFLERANFNVLSHYEFAPALEVFLEAKYDRVRAVGNNAGPAFIQTGTGNQGNIGDARATLAAAMRTGFPVNKIIFEFTESEAMDADHILNILRSYRAMGFKTAIDDFGAGYAGLGLLTLFQPDIVKLDMALIRDIALKPSPDWMKTSSPCPLKRRATP